MHRKNREISGFGQHLLPTPSEGGHPPSEDQENEKKLPPTYHHGFDLTIEQGCEKAGSQNLSYNKALGYYAVDLCNTEIPIRLIAMNTAKTEEWGVDAYISARQRTWLKKTLLRDGDGINLIFSHHRPNTFDTVTVGIPLTRNPPYRSQRALLTHWAPTLGFGVKAVNWLRL